MSYSNNIYVGPFLIVKSFGKVEDRDTSKVCSKNRDHKKYPHYVADQYCSICESPLIISTPVLIEKSFYIFCRENNIDNDDFYVPEFINGEDKNIIIDNIYFWDFDLCGIFDIEPNNVSTEDQIMIKEKWKILIELLKKNSISYEYHFGVVNYQS